MAVTTANTLKLSDVCLEIYGSSNTLGKSLAGLHAAATGTFNPTYAVAGADTLLDFRGYSHGVSYTGFALSASSFTSGSSSCMYSGSTQVLYHNGAGTYPVNGDIIYTTSAGTTAFNGGNLYWRLPAGQGNASIYISTSGVVSLFSSCL